MSAESENHNKLKSIQEEIRKGLSELDTLEHKVVTQRETLHTLRGELWDLCDHQWKRDYSCAFDDLCKHYCMVCGLWKDRSLYGSKTS